MKIIFTFIAGILALAGCGTNELAKNSKLSPLNKNKTLLKEEVGSRLA